MSNLTLYRPRGLGIFDRAFSDLFDGSWNTESTYDFNPRVEIMEGDKEFHLDLEAPGMKKDDIHVEVNDGVLRLWGERKFEKEDKDSKCCYSESRYGAFDRSFRLPRTVVSDKIHAKYDAGILTLTIPKTKEAERKAIEVKVE